MLAVIEGVLFWELPPPTPCCHRESEGRLQPIIRRWRTSAGTPPWNRRVKIGRGARPGDGEPGRRKTMG